MDTNSTAVQVRVSASLDAVEAALIDFGQLP